MNNEPSHDQELNSDLSLVFECGGEIFAVTLLGVREISEPLPARSFPSSHPAFVGMANLRGEVLGIVNLQLLLRLPKASPTGKEVVIVLKDSEEGAMAILVDRVLETTELEPMDMHCLAQTAIQSASEFVVKIGSYKGKVAPVLDLSGLLNHQDWKGSIREDDLTGGSQQDKGKNEGGPDTSENFAQPHHRGSASA